MNEKECREIYREAFRDPDDQFENRLFSLCGEYCRTLMRDGRTAAMLFALPCRITGGKKPLPDFTFTPPQQSENTAEPDV